MIDERDLFERSAARFDPPTDAFERFTDRRERHERNRRVAATVVTAVVLAAVAAAAAWILRDPNTIEPAPPPDAFAGAHGWIALGGIHKITAVNPTGNDPARVLWPEGGTPLIWSADGTKLLVLQDSNLVVLSSDGTKTTLTHVNPRDLIGGGSFTPNGDAVVYEDGWSILQVPLAGGTPTVIAKGDPEDRRGYLFPFFRGGQVSSKGVIAYGSVPPINARDGQVWLMDLDGSNRRKLISARAFADAFGDRGLESIDAEAWSPDGSRLLIMAVSNKGSDGVEAAAYVINADGTDLHRVTPPGTSLWSATFSPDGRSITGVEDDGELVTVSIEGSKVRQVGTADGDLNLNGQNSAWNPVAP